MTSRRIYPLNYRLLLEFCSQNYDCFEMSEPAEPQDRAINIDHPDFLREFLPLADNETVRFNVSKNTLDSIAAICNERATGMPVEKTQELLVHVANAYLRKRLAAAGWPECVGIVWGVETRRDEDDENGKIEIALYLTRLDDNDADRNAGGSA